MYLRRIFRFSIPHFPFMFLGIFFAVLGVVAALVPPELTKILVDEILVPTARGGAGDKLPLLLKLLGILGAAIVLRALGIFGRTISLEIFSQRTIRDLKKKLYDHILGLSNNFFYENRTGELMARITSDVEALREMFSQGIIKISFGLSYIVLTGIVLFSLNLKLALWTIVPSPLALIVAIIFARTIRPRFIANRKQYSELNARIQESISGIRVVKTFNCFLYELERFNKENYGLSAMRNRALHVWIIFAPLLELISSISMVFLLLFGGKMVVDGEITLGLWVQFSGYLWMLIMPMRVSGEIVNAFTMASASGERIFQILDMKSDLTEAEEPVSIERISGKIEFKNVSWIRKGHEILKDISFRACPGEVIALMGATGSGKTSIVNLISRFFDPTEGEILIDGIDIKEYGIRDLRNQVAVVSQEPFLFSETISANIAFGRVKASMDEIKRSAVRSCAHSFISGLNSGYDNIVGERGTGLSGGQKQRASIARALIKEAPVLILDDSTSSVDMETEDLIQKSLEHHYTDTTVFYIAHRISSVMHADRILFIKDGSIVESGNHSELLARKGEYYQIFCDQYQDVIERDAIKE